MPENPILIARNIGPAELLDYGRKLKGIVLEEGSVGSHATIIARALAIPLIIHVENITTEALNGDPILVDGDQGIAHLRPDESVKAHSWTKWPWPRKRRNGIQQSGTRTRFHFATAM